MKQQGQQQLLEAVGDVRRKLEEWRTGERASRRIPESIWDEAVGLANQYGVCRVCQELQLGYKSLKKRMSLRSQVAATTAPAFLEWISPGSTTIEHCALELESGRGAKLRLEMSGVPASALATLIREFAG